MTNKNAHKPGELLRPLNMLRLYATGAFPMADEKGIVRWYMPDVRAIIPLDSYNIPRSLQKQIPKLKFEIKYDTDFLSVIKFCADRESTWINNELIDAYRRLHKLGHIHTVEVYKEDNLVGGLYGVSYRGAFFGESMFSKVPQASKVALTHLLKRLNDNGFVLLDVQYINPHLEMFGAKEISFEQFESLLQKSYFRNCTF